MASMQQSLPDSRAILVAASDPATRDVLDELLREEGYQVRMAQDVDQATEWLTRGRVQLALVDLDLRGGGAVPVLAAVAGRVPPVPVALLTNLLPLDADRRATDLGVAAFLNRPLNLDRVLEVTVGLVRGAG